MEILAKNYQKYKWFYTSSDKLVLGGKSAIQNDFLLKTLKKSGKDYVIMHTSSPGSPFTVILDDVKSVSEKDIEECAIFTGSFSRAWKECKEHTQVDIFKLSQLYKSKTMKTGTWAVKGEINRKIIPVSLVLTTQNGFLRAVPFSTVDKKSILLKISAGTKDKTQMLDELKSNIPQFTKEEILAALPAGGVKIQK